MEGFHRDSHRYHYILRKCVSVLQRLLWQMQCVNVLQRLLWQMQCVNVLHVLLWHMHGA